MPGSGWSNLWCLAFWWRVVVEIQGRTRIAKRIHSHLHQRPLAHSQRLNPNQLYLNPYRLSHHAPCALKNRSAPTNATFHRFFLGSIPYHAVEATIRTEPQPFQSAANPQEAAKAVVQIYRCINNNCDSAVGSGVIIHPSGIIATA